MIHSGANLTPSTRFRTQLHWSVLGCNSIHSYSEILVVRETGTVILLEVIRVAAVATVLTT